jgi:hypothetical protein
MNDLRFTHRIGEAIELAHRDQVLLRYVYAPVTLASESPKPFFHPLRTLAGNLVTIFRPHDHLWHHGLAMTMAQLSGQNFWGGPTYVRDRGYVALPNNGRIVHQAWDDLRADAGGLAATERLTWISSEGEPWIAETRTLAVPAIVPDEGYWALDLSFALTNQRAEVLRFGSPTTEGRPLAGYGGLFWRGPRSFLRGTILAADGLAGPEVMGKAAPWLAFVGAHDGTGDTSTILFLDHPTNPRFPTKWFVRNDPYACVSGAFSFDEEYLLAPGDTLALTYRIVIADGGWPVERLEALSQQWSAVGGVLSLPTADH